MNSLPTNCDSLNQAAGYSQTSSGEALREIDYPGSCSNNNSKNKMLLTKADTVRAFLGMKRNENDIYAQPVKAIYKSLSWRQIEALENVTNIFLNFCKRAKGEDSKIGKMELYVNVEDYEQLLIFENMLIALN